VLLFESTEIGGMETSLLTLLKHADPCNEVVPLGADGEAFWGLSLVRPTC
jgi:hypothetical protein